MKKKLCETLRAARKSCGYTMPQVEKLLAQAGAPAGKSSVSRWETGYSNPSVEQFLALCRIYDIRDAVGVFAGEGAPRRADGLNAAGRRKLEEYRQLLVASGLYCAEKAAALPLRRIPFYEQSASAGFGVFLDSQSYTEVEAGPGVPLSATFGLPLSGDSMEPEFHDGDSVWVHQQQTLEDGETGLFMLNGQAYVKRLEAGTGGVRLISLNPAYAPVSIGAGDAFRVLGKVVARTSADA